MDRSGIERTYSDNFIPGMSEYDLFRNKNVEWLSAPFFKVGYVLLVIAVWAMLHISTMFPKEDCWTVTNIIHGVVTFILFHWVKGSPDESMQGEYDAFTLYEQIDAGVPWTSTKKFLMLIPTFLTWLACHTSDYKPIYLVVNCGMFFICIIAKIPQMHRVRIFGINSTPGIDKPVEIRKKPKQK